MQRHGYSQRYSSPRPYRNFSAWLFLFFVGWLSGVIFVTYVLFDHDLGKGLNVELQHLMLTNFHPTLVANLPKEKTTRLSLPGNSANSIEELRRNPTMTKVPSPTHGSIRAHMRESQNDAFPTNGDRGSLSQGSNPIISTRAESSVPKSLAASNAHGPQFHSNSDAVTTHEIAHSFAEAMGKDRLPIDRADDLWILLDWPIDDRIFTAENFKALESFLSIYPNAIFRVLLPAPYDAYSHKTGNLLSVNHFVKYKRKGYDIEVVPVSSMLDSGPPLGLDYRREWMKKCCHRCNARCRVTDHVQPYHVLTYIRLMKLYPRGGIFTDFSFLLLGLDMILFFWHFPLDFVLSYPSCSN